LEPPPAPGRLVRHTYRFRARGAALPRIKAHVSLPTCPAGLPRIRRQNVEGPETFRRPALRIASPGGGSRYSGPGTSGLRLDGQPANTRATGQPCVRR
jgi:hypothetical protein